MEITNGAQKKKNCSRAYPCTFKRARRLIDVQQFFAQHMKTVQVSICTALHIRPYMTCTAFHKRANVKYTDNENYAVSDMHGK